ncbi:TonB-dependent receptor domain-containing protein [Caulobacter sp. UC70_42]|uniref:TonB-dependent receptor domain-containing protein n=1 Tax=Caulobacter sp. UC70_42 TaxID=3374551 RepID=UPI00375691C8
MKGLGDWTYDAYFSYGRVDDGTTYTGYLSRSATQRLLDASDGGNSLCAGGFNPFGETKLSASCINYISRIAKNTTVNDQRVFEANVQGGVFDLPAGQVRLALGGTYREQNYKLVPDALLLATFTLNGVTGPELAGNSAQPLAGSDSVYEGYGEILIPLLRDLPFVHRLETNLGYRVSKYNSIGGVQSYKADASWEIVERLRVRGGIQRAVRAPSIGELFGPQNLSFPSIGVPVSSNGRSAILGRSLRRSRLLSRAGRDGRSFGSKPLSGAERAGAGDRRLHLLQLPGLGSDGRQSQPARRDRELVHGRRLVAVAVRQPLAWPPVGSIDYYDISIKQVVGTVSVTNSCGAASIRTGSPTRPTTRTTSSASCSAATPTRARSSTPSRPTPISARSRPPASTSRSTGV